MRLPNWERSLIAFLHNSANKTFQWGQFDCCLFACDAAKLVNGVDGAADFRDRYTTKVGAFRALKRIGKGNINDTLTSIFGEPIPYLIAKRGDIALVHNNNEEIAAVVFNGIWAASEQRGLVSLDAKDVIHCWSIN